MSDGKLSDFPIDKQVLSRIRPMVQKDVPAVSKMHAMTMADTLWGKLGEPFLQTLYGALLTHPDFLGYVYVEDETVRGFIAGTLNGPQMMKQTFRANTAKILRATAKGLAGHPKSAFLLARTFGYFKTSQLPGLENIRAESMFCSFAGELRGTRISGVINKVLFDEVAANGHKFIKITSEADNRGAIRQLTSWGFENLGVFHFYGKDMIAWRLNLENCERVNPKDRIAR